MLRIDLRPRSNLLDEQGIMCLNTALTSSCLGERMSAAKVVRSCAMLSVLWKSLRVILTFPLPGRNCRLSQVGSPEEFGTLQRSEPKSCSLSYVFDSCWNLEPTGNIFLKLQISRWFLWTITRPCMFSQDSCWPRSLYLSKQEAYCKNSIIFNNRIWTDMIRHVIGFSRSLKSSGSSHVWNIPQNPQSFTLVGSLQGFNESSSPHMKSPGLWFASLRCWSDWKRWTKKILRNW